MATTILEPLLNCQRSKRFGRKKLIAALLLLVILGVVVGSIFAYGKSSKKFHKKLHKLEDQLEDLQKSYMSSLSFLQRDLASTKSQLQTLTNQTQNAGDVMQSQRLMSSSGIDKAFTGFQQELKEAKDEIELQREAMKELVKLFESYRQETSKELLQLKEAHSKDQEEISRLSSEIQQHVSQKSDEKRTMETTKDASLSQDIGNVKDIPVKAPEIKPKANPNALVRSARAVKEYVSNLAAKLNPFRSSKDKNVKPAVAPKVLQQEIQTEKIQALAKNVDNILGNIVSMLDVSNLDDVSTHAQISHILQSKFHHLDLALEDFAKSNVGAQDKIMKWKKNYFPVKEQLERIRQENAAHDPKGHHSHKHGSKQLHKLANMTRHLKDTFHSFL